MGEPQELSTRRKEVSATAEHRSVYCRLLLSGMSAGGRVGWGRTPFDNGGAEADEKRTDFLKQFKVTVLRFENRDVFENLEGVLDAIRSALGTTPPFAEKRERHPS